MEDEKQSEWKSELERGLGREFTANEHKLLQAISDLHEELEWREAIYPRDLEIFAPDIKLKVPDLSKSLSDGLWTARPESEYSLVHYIVYLLEIHDCPVPEFLRSRIDTSEIRHSVLQRNLAKETRLWKNRLGNLSQQRVHEDPRQLEIRLKLVGKSLRWEGRDSPDGTYEVITAKDFGQWLAKDFSFFERFEPGSIALCALFQEYHKFSQRARLDLERNDDCAFLNKLLLHPVTRRQIVDRNDAPLKTANQRLRWTGIDDGIDEDGYYQLRLELDNGDGAPFPLTYLPGETPLYLHAETLYHGPALLRADESPNQRFRIPVAAMEAPEGLLFLRNHSVPLPESVGDNIVCIPMQARLYLDIHNLDTKNEWDNRQRLDCRLVAISPDQNFWFLLTSDGWESCPNLEAKTASPEAPEGALFEQPTTNFIETVLEAFELEEEEEAGVWSREIGPDFPTAFIDWIQSMPSEIQLVPDEELDTLVDGRPAGRYALAIENEEGSDWFNVKLNPEFLDTRLSDQERELIMKARGSFAYLPGKGWSRFELEVANRSQDLMDSLGLQFDEAKSGGHAIHTLQLADAKLEDTSFEQLKDTVRKRSKELSAKTPTNVPKGIRSQLRPYQVEGFQFLAFLSRNRFGGVLADDMGLGKTLQTLAWLTWLKLSRPAKEPFHCLVVCPKSVMHVWKQEVEIHTTKLSIGLFDPDRVFNATWQAADIDILVANYSQLRIRKDFFLNQNWTVTILDEAQYIKNPISQTARAARNLKSEHRIALTGTPVENRAMDLWSIFAYAMPGLLGSKTSFSKQYKENDSQTPARLANRVRHFMIRRSKKQVATDLPERIEESLICQMEGEQRDLYMAELKLAQRKVLNLEPGSAFEKERFNILASLLRLRQICCHPSLIDRAYAKVRSAKLEALLDHVSELQDEGHKVLIFSQFVEMLNIISGALKESKCSHLMLTGKTKNREELVDQFQNDDTQTAFLLSLRAAGSGLNLTAASYVILYDPWWNPAVEAQAIDRTHRIGQKDTVNAYRLVTKDSIEQKIQSLQYKKEALANEIVREESLAQILDLDNLKYVLSE